MTAEQYQNYHPYLSAAVGGVLAVGISMVADDYLGHLFVWGGSDCTRHGEMLACFGYLPAGFVIIAFVCVMVAAGVVGYLSGVVE
jgi:hypothetical protein